MRVLCMLLAILSVLIGLAFFAGSKSAIHEILAGVMFLIAAVLGLGAGVLGRLDDIKALLKERPPTA